MLLVWIVCRCEARSRDSSPARWVRVTLLTRFVPTVGLSVAGFADAMPIRPGTASDRGLLVHMSLAMAVILLYLVEFLMRLGIPPDRPVSAGLLVFALSTFAVLLVTICWGAALAHRQA